jgi:hypothetical protein
MLRVCVLAGVVLVCAHHGHKWLRAAASEPATTDKTRRTEHHGEEVAAGWLAHCIATYYYAIKNIMAEGCMYIIIFNTPPIVFLVITYYYCLLLLK